MKRVINIALLLLVIAVVGWLAFLYGYNVGVTLMGDAVMPVIERCIKMLGGAFIESN